MTFGKNTRLNTFTGSQAVRNHDTVGISESYQYYLNNFTNATPVHSQQNNSKTASQLVDILI